MSQVGFSPLGPLKKQLGNGDHNMETQTRTYLYSHTCADTAYIVNDYPWGFRLRTQIRYWIESKDAKNGGQRFVSQTINPKTGQWCAPKKGTYYPIMIMFLDEKDCIKCECLMHHNKEDFINEFKQTHLERLSDFQKRTLKEIIAFTNVMKNVTFKCEMVNSQPVDLFSKDPEEIAKKEKLFKDAEEREAEREKSFKAINRAISCEMNKVVL